MWYVLQRARIERNLFDWARFGLCWLGKRGINQTPQNPILNWAIRFGDDSHLTKMETSTPIAGHRFLLSDQWINSRARTDRRPFVVGREHNWDGKPAGLEKATEALFHAKWAGLTATVGVISSPSHTGWFTHDMNIHLLLSQRNDSQLNVQAGSGLVLSDMVKLPGLYHFRLQGGFTGLSASWFFFKKILHMENWVSGRWSPS